MLKNWCFWTVVLEKILKSPWDFKEIQPVHPKGDQSWIFIGRTDAEAETPTLWPPDAKIWLIGKDPDAGKDWRQKEKGMTEDEVVGWHHWLNGHEFEQTLGVGDGQGSLVCCSPWGHKESDTNEQLNWTDEWTLVTFSICGRCSLPLLFLLMLLIKHGKLKKKFLIFLLNAQYGLKFSQDIYLYFLKFREISFFDFSLLLIENKVLFSFFIACCYVK